MECAEPGKLLLYYIYELLYNIYSTSGPVRIELGEARLIEADRGFIVGQHNPASEGHSKTGL